MGTVIVMTVELGLIHRPVGMHVFAIKSVVDDVTSATIFYGVSPSSRAFIRFVVADLIRLTISSPFRPLRFICPGGCKLGLCSDHRSHQPVVITKLAEPLRGALRDQ